MACQNQKSYECLCEWPLSVQASRSSQRSQAQPAAQESVAHQASECHASPRIWVVMLLSSGERMDCLFKGAAELVARSPFWEAQRRATFLKMHCHEFTGVSFGDEDRDYYVTFYLFIWSFFCKHCIINHIIYTDSIYDRFHLHLAFNSVHIWQKETNFYKYFLFEHCMQMSQLIFLPCHRKKNSKTVIRGSICVISNLSLFFSFFCPCFLSFLIVYISNPIVFTCHSPFHC